jgi:hypothetical protein
MSVGRIGEFDVQSGSWRSYCDRLESYFVVNAVKAEMKLPTLISVVGDVAYELMVNLCSPKKPATMAYDEIVEVMEKHLQPTPSVLAERFKFRQYRQVKGQTVAQYVAELKKMARFCEFEATLDENMRDQFVCGLLSDALRQRLFAEGNINFRRAVSLALSLEAAERDSTVVEGGCGAAACGSGTELLSTTVHSVRSAGCMACGDFRHMQAQCKFNSYVCSRCNVKGHLRRMCPALNGEVDAVVPRHSSSGSTGNPAYYGRRGAGAAGRGRHGPGSAATPARGGARGARSGGRGRSRFGNSRMHWVDDDGQLDQEEVDEGSEEPIYQMSLDQYKPVSMPICVNNKIITFEIDTGSALACINKITYDTLFKEIPLEQCNLTLKFYDGSMTRPLGLIVVDVQYGKINKKLDLYVIDRGTTSLLGRQWLSELCITIPKLTSCESILSSEVVCKHNISDVISRHKEIFDGTLGAFTGGRARLRLRPDAVPVFCRARPLPYALKDRVDAELDAMLRADVIEPVEHSDWATPLVIVNKPDGSLRLCADYKTTLNRVLLVDKFPIPKIEDLFAQLNGSRYFTKLDLSQAYNQVILEDDGSRDLTVINTHRGLFRYKRLVYGLSSSPGIFQRIMSNLLKDIPNVTFFLDDILITGNTLDSHLGSLQQVLRTLSNNGLRIKKQKCSFLVQEVKYLGFVIDKNGVRVDEDKVKPILTMTPPNNVSELKSFIGMINFYGKFVQNLSEYLAPLYELLRKHRKWSWSVEQNRAFVQVKRLLSEAPVLGHYDAARELVLTCDAGPRGVGAVLAMRARSRGAPDTVIAYASRALTPPERNYSQIHKEALAIIYAVKKFHQFLYGRQFTLKTDHKPLVSIFGPGHGIPSMTASRLQRWALILSAYDFNIEYVMSENNMADALSRLIAAYKSTGPMYEDCPEQTYLHFANDAMLLDYNTISKETRDDVLLGRIVSYIRDGWPQETEIRELKPYFNRKSELYTELDCVMWGHRVVVPTACQERVLQELHEPHMGIVKTKALARSYVWWPGLDEAVEALCRACSVCAAVAAAPPRHTPCPWPYPSRSWSRIHLDFLGPIAGVKYLVLVDAYSKWIEVAEMTSTTSKMLIKKLREYFARFGLPKQIVSDNGPPYGSEDFKIFCANNGIEQLFSAPYHPASNGAAENAVKLCKRVIKKAIIQNTDIDTALSTFLLMYRNTPHSTTGESPAKILLGRAARTRLDCLKPDREQRVSSLQRRQREAAGGTRREFGIGDSVWYRLYNVGHAQPKWAAGKVLERIGETNYKIESSLGINHRHIDQLRKRDSMSAVRQNTQRGMALGYPPAQVTVVDPIAGVSSSGSAESSGSSREVGNTRGESRAEPESNPLTGLAPPDPAAAERTRPDRLRPIIDPPRRYGFEDYF